MFTERGAARPQATGTQELILRTVQQHADVLLRIARRHSLCDDDAADAYQRALEIFLRHAARLDAATAHRWLYRVVKHEAMAVREQRQRYLGPHELDPDRLEARHLESPEDRVVAMETMAQAAEALATLKPAELRALWLQAGGRSYAEIAELSGWTRTKVNRSLVEGRRRFLDQRDAIDAGRECSRWRPVLSALVDGEATARQLGEVRPHLRHCAACRAHVRALHRVGPQVAAVLPVGMVAAPAAAADATGWLTRLHEIVTVTVQERMAFQVVKFQAAAEALSAGKMTAVAASAAAIAGGGVAAAVPAHHAPASHHGRPAKAVAVARPAATPPRVTARRTAPAARTGAAVAAGPATPPVRRGAPARPRAEFATVATAPVTARAAVAAPPAAPAPAPAPARTEFGATAPTPSPAVGEFAGP